MTVDGDRTVFVVMAEGREDSWLVAVLETAAAADDWVRETYRFVAKCQARYDAMPMPRSPASGEAFRAWQRRGGMPLSELLAARPGAVERVYYYVEKVGMWP